MAVLLPENDTFKKFPMFRKEGVSQPEKGTFEKISKCAGKCLFIAFNDSQSLNENLNKFIKKKKRS